MLNGYVVVPLTPYFLTMFQLEILDCVLQSYTLLVRKWSQARRTDLAQYESHPFGNYKSLGTILDIFPAPHSVHTGGGGTTLKSLA